MREKFKENRQNFRQKLISRTNLP